MNERHQVAAKKRELVQELIRAGEKPKAVMEKVVTKFGTGVSGTEVYARFHEHHGTTPHPTRGKYPRKNTKKKAKPRTRKAQANRTRPKALTQIRPLEVIVPTHASPSSPAVDTLLSALKQAMRKEGVDSVMIRADGRATIYHVVSREVTIA
jgi:hypothetical protein